MKELPKDAILEVSLTTTSKWLVTCVSEEHGRQPIKLCRWWWQCQLLLQRYPDVPIARVGKAAQKKLWFGNRAR